MQETSANNKRIAKNTIILYLRMMFILCVGLYTGRATLAALGVEDYGLYNVVGGFVVFFTFLNGAMASATQRFITFELARGDLHRQRVTFSTSVIIHVAIGLVIVLLAETVGLWFVLHKLVIPEGRMTAAVWVYQFSILSMLLTIVSVPYNASIIAHEKMSAFAFITIMDTVLRLIIVICLTFVSFDRLIFYAGLLCLVSVIDRLIYGVYCSRHFADTRLVAVFDRRMFREMLNIGGWSLFGNLAGVFCSQGLNVVLNLFFGPAVNAARAVATTIQGIVTGFVSNFQMALNPQITKSYAVGEMQRMHSLIFASSKYSFFLLLAIALPIMVEADAILTLWLKNVPEHTANFTRLILCVLLLDAMGNPLMVSAQATGRVKVYQSVVGGLLIAVLPVSYVVLRLGGNPESVFVTYLVIAVLAFVARAFLIGRMVGFTLITFARRVVIPAALVFAAAAAASGALYAALPREGIWKSLLVVAAAVVFTLVSAFCLGLRRTERTMITGKAKALIQKLRARAGH